MRTLVTGASGFVGAALIPRLRADGHEVCALAREPARVAQALALAHAPAELTDEVELVRGDALSGVGLSRALDQVELAYYLIHSMEQAPARAGSFADRDRLAAETFASEAARAGVRRIVYLGGLVPREASDGWAGAREGSSSSRHLASRLAVERVLLGAVPDSVAFRASIVIGARSRSFRLLVRLVERMRVLTLPSWREYRTQPIDERDITAMLAAAATAPLGGRSLDAGGPDVLSYGEMISRIAELMLLHRPTIGLMVAATGITGRLAATIGGEDPELIVPLMEGLRGDLLLSGESAAELLGVELHSFDAAVEHALGEWERSEPLAAR